MAEICLRHNIFMLVDEIHCDFVPPEHPHTTFGLLGEEVLRHSMVCYSSNKGFNLGGLGMATLVLADDACGASQRGDVHCPDAAGQHLRHGRPHSRLQRRRGVAGSAIAYVSDNKAYLDQFLRERIPQIRMIPPRVRIWSGWTAPSCYRGMALEHFMINEPRWRSAPAMNSVNRVRLFCA